MKTVPILGGMPWPLQIVICVLLGVLALALLQVVAWLLAMVIDTLFLERSGGVCVKVFRRDMDANTVTPEAHVFLPGILARGPQQAEPLLDSMRARGDVYCLTYTGFVLDEERVVGETDALMRSLIDEGMSVTLVGASMGGMLAVKVVRRLRERGCDEPIKLVAIDSPTGGTTMTQLPQWKLPAWLVSALCWFQPSVVTSVVARLPMRMMLVSPKDENIILPYASTSDEMRRIFRWNIKQQAKEGLVGHRFSMYWSQIRWMLLAGAEGLPYEALDGTAVTYMRCILRRTGDNDVVRQPQASEAWKRHVPSLEIIEVDSTHCGFVERKSVWVETFGCALNASCPSR